MPGAQNTRPELLQRIRSNAFPHCESQMRNRAVLSCIAIGLVATVFLGFWTWWWWWMGSLQATPASSAPAAPATLPDLAMPALDHGGPTAPTGAAGSSTGATAGVAVTALPAPGTPVTEVVKALHAQALRGDGRAACRIAADLQRCADADRSLEAASAIATTPAISASGASRQMVDALVRSSERSAQLCHGITADMRADAYRYQAIAADRGDVSTQRWLATRPNLETGDFLAHLDAWQDYRQRAQQFFEGAITQRRLEDLPALLYVYAPTKAPLPRPPYRVDDPIRFLALLQLAQEHTLPIDAPLLQAGREVTETLSPEQRERLLRLRAELQGGWDTSAGASPQAFLPTPDCQ